MFLFFFVDRRNGAVSQRGEEGRALIDYSHSQNYILHSLDNKSDYKIYETKKKYQADLEASMHTQTIS